MMSLLERSKTVPEDIFGVRGHQFKWLRNLLIPAILFLSNTIIDTIILLNLYEQMVMQLRKTKNS